MDEVFSSEERVELLLLRLHSPFRIYHTTIVSPPTSIVVTIIEESAGRFPTPPTPRPSKQILTEWELAIYRNMHMHTHTHTRTHTRVADQNRYHQGLISSLAFRMVFEINAIRKAR